MESQNHKSLSGLIVQFAADAPAFLLLSLEQMTRQLGGFGGRLQNGRLRCRPGRQTSPQSIGVWSCDVQAKCSAERTCYNVRSNNPFRAGGDTGLPDEGWMTTGVPGCPKPVQRAPSDTIKIHVEIFHRGGVPRRGACCLSLGSAGWACDRPRVHESPAVAAPARVWARRQNEN